ncbi:hypothetical protein HG531_004149 [Fusarium graminearum]|nr:hypothetical protein HG531_004149 [Fusarium graminearum]
MIKYTGAKVLATVAVVNVLVLKKAVSVLDATLGLSSLPLNVAEEVEEAGLNTGLLKGTLVEVRVRALIEVVVAFAASVELLAALNIVRRARVGVCVSVELEGVLGEVALQVVAGNERKLNAADRVARTVTPDAGAGLRANVGRLGSARSGSRRSSGRSASGSTRVDAGGALDVVATRGSVVVEAASLAAVATTRAGRSTVTLEAIAPLREVETVKNARPAGVLEARSNVLSTVVVGSLTTVLVLEIRNRWGTPVTALVLAGVGNDDSGKQGLVTIARDIAVTNIGLGSIVGQNITTVAFTTVLETSKPGQSTTLGGVVSVAAVGLVTSNGLDSSGKVGDHAAKVGSLESRILPDVESVVTAACFGVVTSAWVNTVVLETSIAEAVALALGDTLLNGHVVLVLARAVDECTGVAALCTILEASSSDVRLKRIKTRRVFGVPCLGNASQGESRTGDDISKREHSACYQMKGSKVADRG